MTTRPFGLLTAVLMGCAGAEETPRPADRQAAVAEAGASVMPFDLDVTSHVFEKTPAGGVQQVLSDEDDPRQVALIREHLQEEALRFSAGDFHDPEMIHGGEMPGLHELAMGHERLNIQYENVEAGAEIRYSSEDPQLVTALHAWFDAQVSDHGDHAQAHR